MTPRLHGALIDALKLIVKDCPDPIDVDSLPVSRLQKIVDICQVRWIHKASRKLGKRGKRGLIVNPTSEFCDRNKVVAGTVVEIYEEVGGSKLPTIKMVFTKKKAKK